MNLLAITEGWYQYVTGDKAVKDRMKKRLAICETCPEREEVSPTGALLEKIVGERNNLHRCGLCKCNLGPLASLHNPQCKLKKWPS